MSNYKLEFVPLSLKGDNYPLWANDVITYLMSKGLEKILKENKVAESSSADKAAEADKATKDKDAEEFSMKTAKALRIMKQHLDEGLKLEYMNTQDPIELWNNLKERFGYQRQVLLPALMDEWNRLRFQDFKSVNDYNSAMYRIISQLQFCGKSVTEGEKLEKTYSTFHASHVVLQEQYRMRGYTKYSELIAALLLAEKNNELLLKNHQSRPTGTMAFPEVNATFSNQGRGGFGRFRGRGRGRGNSHFRGRGRGRGFVNSYRPQGRGRGFGNSYRPRRNDYNNRSEKGKYVQGDSSQDTCFRCGKMGHWSKVCRTPYHLCKKDKTSEKGKEKEVNFNEHNPEDDSTYLEAEDFTEGSAGLDMD